MMKQKLLSVLLMFAGVGFCLSASAIWSPAWEAKISDEFDTGGIVYKDWYTIGAGGNGVDAYTLSDDVLKVHLIGWPDSGYSGPATKYISISSTVNLVELAKDARDSATNISWDIELTSTFDSSGTETLSWTPADFAVTGDVALEDYAGDGSRSILAGSADMKVSSSYQIVYSKSSSTSRYLRVVIAPAGPESVVLYISLVGGDAVLSWEGSSSENYSIYSTEDLTAGWTFEETVSGIDGTNQWTDDTIGAIGKRFYKVETGN